MTSGMVFPTNGVGIAESRQTMPIRQVAAAYLIA
jgi:hypothetical protein